MDSTATTFSVGDTTRKKQLRGILSFKTGPLLPDNAVITKVILKVRKQGVTGKGDPITAFNVLMVDIRKGPFGSPALQASDFQAVANRTYGPYRPDLVSHLYRLNLTRAKAHINKLAVNGGLTQIRLRLQLDDNNNGVANHLNLYSGNAGAAYQQPHLVVEYYVP